MNMKLAITNLLLVSIILLKVVTYRPAGESQTFDCGGGWLQDSKQNQSVSKKDPTRVEKLFVSTDPADHPQRDHEADIERNEKSDEKLFAAAKGNLDLTKITISSQVDDLKIPAYLFQPLEKRKQNGHPALVWVYGGVHDFFGTNYFPFIQEAVDQGYVVIAPEYRGASGYGKAFYNAIDYGGYEVNDILAASDYLKLKLPHVDPSRIGVIGWSHGGYISLLAATREKNDFACAVAFVPVTNLVFRLSYKGPEYQRMFATQSRIGGLPFEEPELYLDRSPLYHVSKLKAPLLVQVATNDDDVDFVEAEMLVNALKVKQPKLAEVVVYDEPPGGHFFNRQVNLETLVREDTRVQADSWSRTWRFLNWNLKPGQE